MRRADAIEVKNPRHRHRLLPLRGTVVAAAVLFDADSDGVASNFERHVGGIDARHRDLDAPAVLSGVDLERIRAGRLPRANGLVAQELIETIDVTLEIEDVLE